MRSFLFTLFFGLLLALSLSGDSVDARVNTPVNADVIPSKPAIKIGSNTKEQPPQRHRSLLDSNLKGSLLGIVNNIGASALLPGGSNGHRSLGGGVEDAARRSLAQQQAWARDDEGKILWWIWLIIGLSCGFCCIVCCCASACCLRD